MRSAFIEELTRLARLDRNIVLVVGDLGFGVVGKFAEELPAQFVNAGVAEQNMTGIAAGMALSGRTVLTYSIANFPVIRCLEQIRNDVCYHDANVKIVAVGGGMAYGSLGMTHHATEDLAIMRAMPNMVVLAPNDPVEATLATRAAIEHRGPVYLRLGKQGEKREGPAASAAVEMRVRHEHSSAAGVRQRELSGHCFQQTASRCDGRIAGPRPFTPRNCPVSRAR